MGWFAQAMLDHKWLRYALVVIAIVVAVVVTVLTWGATGALTAATISGLTAALSSWAAAGAFVATAALLGAHLAIQWMASTFLTRSLEANAMIRALSIACSAAALSTMLLDCSIITHELTAVDGVNQRTSLRAALSALLLASDIPDTITVSYDDGVGKLDDDPSSDDDITGGQSLTDAQQAEAEGNGHIIINPQEASDAGIEAPVPLDGKVLASGKNDEYATDLGRAVAGLTAGAVIAGVVLSSDDRTNPQSMSFNNNRKEQTS